MTTFIVAAAVGLLLGSALGLFGGGGGILAVPMLVGLLGMDIDQAASASLVIVLFGALGGLISHHRAGRVLWREGVTFGAISVLGATVGTLAAARVADWVKLGAFAVLMVIAGLAMLRNARRQPTSRPVAHPTLVGAGRSGEVAPQDDPGAELVDLPTGTPVFHQTPAAGGYSLPLLVLLATGTGLVTGFLGVGGGFLVVPALVLSLRMPVANATATGLVVIAIASTSSLVVRLTHASAVGTDWALTGVIVAAAVTASMLAARFSGRLSPRALATGFAFLVLGMSLFVTTEAVRAFGG